MDKSGKDKGSNAGADTKGGASPSRMASSNADASSARSGNGSSANKVGYKSNTSHSGSGHGTKSNTPASASSPGKDANNNASSTSASANNANKGASPNSNTILVTPVDQIIQPPTSPPGTPRHPSRFPRHGSVNRDGDKWREKAERVQKEGKEIRRGSPR
ncbi:uncharacterized protein AB675_6509 [Cyphellophora attinorum]|uniref:Uncharacterized protein n=1 Tax=Cyphellophora attinorum TaxID=1664694 RepID=A0A0N0NQP7_9EURO|nr:uncharacterized protein AB675_6509 [Phialophora attinorum]KPI44161.1 hypothetical protein AB675_6509 [Phialophora attinorum]